MQKRSLLLLRGRAITARFIWLDGEFRANVKIKVGLQGEIEDISDVAEGEEENDGEVINIGKNLALLPGFVNAHSHAFHRCLRGRSQIGKRGAENFWKWRQNMYGLVKDIDFASLKKVCVDTFREMLSAGITTVGEFHYVHHASFKDQDGFYGLDKAVVEAAHEVGIRLVLIQTLYLRSGFGQTRVLSGQQRFLSLSVDDFLLQFSKLRAQVDAYEVENAGLVSLALAVHSLRAVPVSAARELFEFARRERLPLHIHLEEQPAELQQCRAANSGKGPGELLLREVLGEEGNGAVRSGKGGGKEEEIGEKGGKKEEEEGKKEEEQGKKIEVKKEEEEKEEEKERLDLLTAVHCTHSERTLLDEFARRGANVCVCPCTEGYLGDGVPTLSEIDSLCIGTDCNNRISMLEEMRWLAFCQNMRTNSRNCCALSAKKLFECATENGAKSLGVDSVCGNFEVGKQFDFFAVSLESGRLAQFIDENGAAGQGEGGGLLDALVFGAGNEEILMSGTAGRVRWMREEKREERAAAFFGDV